VLDGAWLEMQSDGVPPNRLHAIEFWGLDSQSRQFKNFIFDNFAGGRLFSSPGWPGDRLVWTGDELAAQPAIAQEFVFERKSAAGFVVIWQTRKQGGNWIVGDRLSCGKSR
jgi:hypothetical protein